MELSPVSSLKSIGSIGSVNGKSSVTGSGNTASFKEIIKDTLGEVNKLQNQADQSAVDLAAGNIEDVHRAMIDMQKAKLSLDFTVQVRNKVIEAYQEIMRTQV